LHAIFPEQSADDCYFAAAFHDDVQGSRRRR
jgi:hypothetical protein